MQRDRLDRGGGPAGHWKWRQPPEGALASRRRVGDEQKGLAGWTLQSQLYMSNTKPSSSPVNLPILSSLQAPGPPCSSDVSAQGSLPVSIPHLVKAGPTWDSAVKKTDTIHHPPGDSLSMSLPVSSSQEEARGSFDHSPGRTGRWAVSGHPMLFHFHHPSLLLPDLGPRHLLSAFYPNCCHPLGRLCPSPPLQ